MQISVKSVFACLLSALFGAGVTYFSLQEIQETATASGLVNQQTAQLPNALNDNTDASINGQDIEQQLKDLRTRFIGDPRSIVEKQADFLAQNPGLQSIAIVAKVLVDLAENQALLSDKDVKHFYQQQSDLTLKRVLAQVLSMRGDNQLLDKYISQLQGSHGESPEAQQKLLVELAKTHYVGALVVIEPLLQSDNNAVLLDALLALRATGNESQLHLAQALLNHSDPSVSWLARDAINQLQYLSKKARTRLTLADIAAELPPISQ